ncbi:MAG TPA: ABC transporter permease [Defluviitaleaceae bacterium]|nr:ABC transporter permease [Defluviitaleaceae bacterium]HPT75496.1 ABC transporter permease [Defluviitaleaceae bacterium]
MGMTNTKNKAELIKDKLKKNISLTAFIILFIFFSLTTDGKFLTSNNIQTLLGASIDLLICALGATFIIMLGSIDLSSGSMISLCGVIAAKIYETTTSTLAAVLAAIAVSVLFYGIMGVAHTRLQVPTFIVTLGFLSIARAVVTMISSGTITMIPFDSPFKKYFGLKPWIIILGLVMFIIVWLIERYTLFGRYTRLIGGDERVAKLSGINVNKQKVLVFLFAGLLTAIGGVVMAARIGSGSPAIGQGYELNVISAVVLGGTSQRGGIGGVRGTLIGALTLAVLSNGLVLLGMPSEVQLFIKGIVLILAVYVTLERNPNAITK